MPEITLVRQDAAPIAPQDAEAARRVFFGIVDGLGERGRKQWRRLWNGLMRLQPGEMVEITTVQPRLGWYHRKHMALEQAVFEAQERFEDFESFRTWLKVGASFVDWYPGPKGGVIPVPRSISYAKLEQGDMEQFHNDAVAFLRTEHAGRTPLRRAVISTRSETEQEREQRLMDKARRAMNSVVPRAAAMGLGTTAAAPIPKAAPVRSEPYRRVVATLPCAICGVHGYSQAAHANQGKGMGMKACDLTCFPACGPRPGIQGCHAALDQGALFTKAVRRELEPVWAADTQRRIQAMGMWPKALPLQQFSTGDDFERTLKNRT